MCTCICLHWDTRESGAVLEAGQCCFVIKSRFLCVRVCVLLVAMQLCRPEEVVKRAKAVASTEHQWWENVEESWNLGRLTTLWEEHETWTWNDKREMYLVKLKLNRQDWKVRVCLCWGFIGGSMDCVFKNGRKVKSVSARMQLPAKY